MIISVSRGRRNCRFQTETAKGQGRRARSRRTHEHKPKALTDDAPREVRTLCTVLHDTGMRESEALELSAERVDLNGGCVVVRTLKKRHGKLHYRSIPVSPATLDELDLVHTIRQRQRKGAPLSTAPLWPISRTTLWRRVGEVMHAANIKPGPRRRARRGGPTTRPA